MAKDDATRMDLKQNKAIKSVEDRLDDIEKKLSELTDSAALEQRLSKCEHNVNVLAPLVDLVGSVAMIRRHFGGIS